MCSAAFCAQRVPTDIISVPRLGHWSLCKTALKWASIDIFQWLRSLSSFRLQYSMSCWQRVCHWRFSWCISVFDQPRDFRRIAGIWICSFDLIRVSECGSIHLISTFYFTEHVWKTAIAWRVVCLNTKQSTMSKQRQLNQTLVSRLLHCEKKNSSLLLWQTTNHKVVKLPCFVFSRIQSPLLLATGLLHANNLMSFIYLHF